MQSIHTRKLNPTNTRGTRVKAFTTDGMQVTLPWDYSLDVLSNHFKAARALTETYSVDWNPDWNIEKMPCGESLDGRGLTFVLPFSVMKNYEDT
jgi:hypothetical protein